MKHRVLSVLIVLAAALSLITSPALSAPLPGEPFGVWANSSTNSIQVIDPVTLEVSDALLQGQLGSYGGGLFDVVITPDGKTAIVSNFGDSTVYFVDMTFPACPLVVGSVRLDGWAHLSIFAEDMTVSPDGRTLFVTNGGFANAIATVDIPTRTLIGVTPFGTVYHNAIEITPDGQTILTADYFAGAVHVFTFDPVARIPKYMMTHNLIDPSSWPAGVSVPPDFNLKWFSQRPVNLAISPDGQTAIANDATRDQAAIFRIRGPGFVTFEAIVAPGGYPRIPQEDPTYPGGNLGSGCQTIAFTPDGKRAYMGVVSSYGFLPWGPEPTWKFTEILALDITGPGKATPAGIHIMINPLRGTSQLFGVETMAIDPSGRYLWYTNPTLSGGVFSTAVVDLATNTQIAEMPAIGFDPKQPSIKSIPTGIAFWSGRTPPVQGSITVTSPAGGEEWTIGSAQSIIWTSTGVTGNVNINLYRKGSLLGKIAGNVPVADGAYNWTAGSYKKKVAKRGQGYAIQIVTTDGSVQATSGAFKLKK